MRKRLRPASRFTRVADGKAVNVIAASGTLQILEAPRALLVQVIGTSNVIGAVDRGAWSVEEPVVAINEHMAVVCNGARAMVVGAAGAVDWDLPSTAVSAAVHGHSAAVSTECGTLVVNGTPLLLAVSYTHLTLPTN